MKRRFVILFVFIALMMLATNSSSANSNQYTATDSSVFGENALSANSEEDQSKKLEHCIQKAALDGKELYIPAGLYYINSSVSFNQSNINIVGDKNKATILKNKNHMSKDDNEKVLFDASAYNKKDQLNIEYLFLDGIEIRLRNVSHVEIENNIFYDPSIKFVIYIEDGKDFHIDHNIFLRDQNHTVPGSDRSRTIYAGGYYYSSNSFKWTEDITIKDNVIGAKINELDAMKSLQKENKNNISRLQSAIKNQEIDLANDQNYLTTGVNSFGMLKTVYIEDNVFYSFWEDDMMPGEQPITNDHVTYLRGSQNVYISGNHVRGFHNGPAGGFKFKSGRNVVINNNYLRNTGVILSNHPEYGYGETFDDGEISEFTNMLIGNNVFDFKNWQANYGIGINYEVDNPAGLTTKIENNVFIENQYIHYHNIPQNRRLGFGLPDSFKPQTTYIKDNFRDDTDDHILTIQNIDDKYSGQFDDLMAKDWKALLSAHKSLEEYYVQRKNQPIPCLDTLARAVPTTVELGQVVAAEDLVTNAYGKDYQKPTFTIMNPEAFKKAGKKEISVKIEYADQLPEVNITVPVTIKDTIAPQITVKKTTFERGETILLSDVITVTDYDDKLDMNCVPAINTMKVGTQRVKMTVSDSSGNHAEQAIDIVINKSKLQREIEDLFDQGGKIKAGVSIEKINTLKTQVEQVKNIVLKKEYSELLENARKQIESDYAGDHVENADRELDMGNINERVMTGIRSQAGGAYYAGMVFAVIVIMIVARISYKRSRMNEK